MFDDISKRLRALFGGKVTEVAASSQSAEDLERSAFHEAGHAVLFYFAGYRQIGGINLRGNLAEERSAETLISRVEPQAHTFEFIKTDMEAWAAGYVAEAIRFGDVDEHGVSFDFDWLHQYAHELLVKFPEEAFGSFIDLDTPEDAKEYFLRMIYNDARQKLQSHWHVVEAVAHAAIEKNELSGEEVVSIIREAQSHDPHVDHDSRLG